MAAMRERFEALFRRIALPGEPLTPFSLVPACLADINGDNQYLITNNHVLEEVVSVRVRREDKTWAAAISKCDADLDLCQLRVLGLNAPPSPLRLSVSHQIQFHSPKVRCRLSPLGWHKVPVRSRPNAMLFLSAAIGK
jgi:hypothetical protein